MSPLPHPADGAAGGPAGPVVVLTRAPDDNAPLAAALRRRGAAVVEIPLIERALDVDALARCAARCPQPDVVLFTSRFAVEALGPTAPALLRPRRVLCVGPATAAAAAAAGWQVEPGLTPAAGRATGPDAVRAAGLEPGAVVLFPGPAEPNPATLAALSDAGVALFAVPVYRNDAPADATEALRSLRAADAVVLSAPSAARRWVACPLAHQVPVFAIGPTTASEARRIGLPVAALLDPDPDRAAVELISSAAPHPPGG